ncbi:Rossmann-like alpha/beta/alpha sandwich fold protein [Metarhizium album ARSEF 1941]|uniref:Rossmann-like alpha/beta/alpha sandwich fold protein n=1 Tax=Metarhizium album (strain ARSEF 1941) TaxID=1081103 RepID=A0A0B2WLK9_METAS|nr:Rossmann-like alpha/beta/alpha sandwich fold protein [Metarhizium album ARSEF 1941]KHN94803.1 Rossmann-like alpha/beta/alpha sandwich fold protein [Metarhizium album ARSEF 1941]
MSTLQTAGMFADALKAFSASRDAFRVLSTVPRASPSTSPPPPPRSLIVLDSSFNPPTRAHAQMACSAVRQAGLGSGSSSDSGSGSGSGARLVLLLAVTNADKGLVPAPLEARLGMMQAFGRDLRRCGLAVPIDVAVTTRPYFRDKAAAIAAAGVYAAAAEPELVFLCGFDTAVRIFDPKYYRGAGGMAGALGPFFRRARLRVTMRPGGAWGAAEEQAAYVSGLGARLEAVGGDASWVTRIEWVDAVDGADGAVSSSRVREVVRRPGGDAVSRRLDGLVGDEVGRWIDEMGLYREQVDGTCS